MNEYLQWVLGIASVLVPTILVGMWVGTSKKVDTATEKFVTEMQGFSSTLTEFRVEMKHTNQTLKEVVEKLPKLEDHETKIALIHQAMENQDGKINYLSKWREEHEKEHAANR